MKTTINKVDDFLEAFPNKISKHTGHPDYEILHNIKTALKCIFAMVPCTLGRGAHGYLGAVLTAAEYAAATPINMPPLMGLKNWLKLVPVFTISEQQPSEPRVKSMCPTSPSHEQKVEEGWGRLW